MLTPKQSTVNFVVKNDPKFADQVIGHNETGENRECWRAPTAIGR